MEKTKGRRGNWGTTGSVCFEQSQKPSCGWAGLGHEAFLFILQCSQGESPQNSASDLFSHVSCFMVNMSNGVHLSTERAWPCLANRTDEGMLCVAGNNAASTFGKLFAWVRVYCLLTWCSFLNNQSVIAHNVKHWKVKSKLACCRKNMLYSFSLLFTLQK